MNRIMMGIEGKAARTDIMSANGADMTAAGMMMIAIVTITDKKNLSYSS
jgi:hypothetical protein